MKFVIGLTTELIDPRKVTRCIFNIHFNIILACTLNLLTPNVNYSGRTAPLTSKVAFYIFIQQI